MWWHHIAFIQILQMRKLRFTDFKLHPMSHIYEMAKPVFKTLTDSNVWIPKLCSFHNFHKSSE